MVSKLFGTECGREPSQIGPAAAEARLMHYSGRRAEIPYLELAEPEEGYHGLVRENETLVELTPPVRARGAVCSFLILNNKHHGEVPFEIMVIDENEARLRVRYPLNCEKRRNYKFDIAAVGCDGSYSNTVPVHITVTDVNEYAPVWSRPAYVRAVDEGRLYDELVRVEATDRDCTPRYGDICKYEIRADPERPQPFTIDNEGVIRNTEPLEYEKWHNHILSVVAYDCGMKRSEPVMVTITVNKPCRAGWKGIAERVDYAPGTGPLALFPAARLAACSSDERCPGVTRIQAVVSLQASRAGTGCDRDTYSLHSQRTICGLNQNTIDLLPGPGAGNEWAKALKPDSGHDGEHMFEFDGETTSAVVPEAVLAHSLGSTFSISTWMRHAPRPDNDKHRKEHILCLADDHKMNRHHYALFVRNCRLILLLRRDFGDGDLNIFRPAEWRWKIPEVCDNEWHHYAVNVRFPNVELYVDGEAARARDAAPEVIDDWPLHPAHGINTTLVVGACWQGSEGGMKHHLRGWLAGLGVARAPQHPHQLQCVAQCREGLSLAPDLYLKSVSVEGDGVADVETLLRRVAYGDARAYPTPGRRNVHLATTITCDNGRILKARPAESYIMVLQPQTPTILINGSGDCARDYSHFRAGLRVFPELSVRVMSHNGDTIADASVQKLDSCVVSVYPALNPDHEALSLRDAASLPDRYDIRAAVTRDGVILTGADTVHNYQKVLRDIEYSNKKPAYYLNRVFKLTCSELNGRFTSNEYVQTLTVIHPHMGGAGGAGDAHHDPRTGIADKMAAVQRDDQGTHAHVDHHGAGLGAGMGPRAYAAHAQRDAHSAELPAPHVRDLHTAAADSNHVALLIGVICCGVVVLGVGVGVARARTPRRRRRRAPPPHTPHAPRPVPPLDTEMAWDDSALTITVNPMDEAAQEVGISAGGGADNSDGESCSDSDSEHRDSSDDDDDEAPGKQHKYRNISQLEWDNSTM